MLTPSINHLRKILILNVNKTSKKPTDTDLMSELSTEARELELYATNVQCWIAPVIRTLGKKWRDDRATFSLDRAIAYVDRYCLVPAAKQYKIEHGSMATPWHAMFPKPVRLQAAEAIVRRHVAEFRLGNFWD